MQRLPRRLGGEGVVRRLRDITGCVVVLVLAVGSPTLQVFFLSSLWDVVALLLEHGVCVHLVGKRSVSVESKLEDDEFGKDLIRTMHLAQGVRYLHLLNVSCPGVPKTTSFACKQPSGQKL